MFVIVFGVEFVFAFGFLVVAVAVAAIAIVTVTDCQVLLKKNSRYQ